MTVAKRLTAALLAVALLWVTGTIAQQKAPDGASREDDARKLGPGDDRPDTRRPMPPDRERRPQFDGPGGPDGPPDRRPGEGPPPPHGPPHLHFNREHEQRRLEELKEVDPELYELERSDAELDRETHELAETLRRALREAREELKKELHGIVSKHFDVRQARRELHLVRLREELDKLTDSMKKRKDAREQIIGRRVSELMGEEDDMAF
ncbi:MAG: hypothetical protein CMJ64_25800 [Planctomycetaceae bacterium]|nr:hypothetical protein [Planctomycetaceae bacterium]